MRKYQTSEPSLFYYQTGENPRLLIHTGTHGDEYEVIDLVMEAVKKYEDYLPSFVFVPVVSPSAVAKRTRNNGRGIDMNREFYSDSDDKEVVANIEILENKEFDLFVSFHEDPGSSFCYIHGV